MTARTPADGGKRLRAITISLVAVAALALLAFAYQLASLSISGDAVSLDFRAFWGAARLALDGAATSAFDPVQLRMGELRPGPADTNQLPWLYPPTWLLLVLPLGALPFFAAWLVFCLLSLAALIAAFRFAQHMFARTASLEAAAVWIASPAVVLSLMLGQTSLLWTAALITTLASLEARREATAGICLALMTAKPQLGLLIPIALAARRRWRAILAATGFALVFAGVATVAFGVEYWREMWGALERFSAEMSDGGVRLPRQVSLYALARTAGAEHGLALATQGVGTLAAAAALFIAWRTPGASPTARAAALCFAIPLGPHYVFHYEMTLLLAGAFFLMLDGATRSVPERILLILCWTGPGPGLAFPDLTPVSAYGAPLAALGLIAAVRRARATP